MNKHDCLKPSKQLELESDISNDWAFNYKTKAGQKTVALRIPGIEFVVQNMTGQKASANREKFLLLIEDWKKQQASVLGKRAPASSSSAAVSKIARIENGGAVANALVVRTIKTMSAVSGAVQGLNSSLSSGVQTISTKVEGVQDRVKQGTNEVKKLAASVDANHRQQLQAKDEQIKKLQEDKRTLQEANERQRAQIAKMNKERDELLLKADNPQFVALRDKVDVLFRSVENVNKVASNSRDKLSTFAWDMQKMQASSTMQYRDLQEIKALLAAISAAIAP